MPIRTRPLLTLILLACLLPPSVLAFSTGPPANRVMLCGTAAGCNACHSQPDPIMSIPEVTFELAGGPFPAGYTPDTDYSLILRIVENAVTRCDGNRMIDCLGNPTPVPAMTCLFGFQIASIRATSCAGMPLPSGTFSAVPPETQLAPGGGVDFLEHTGCGILPTLMDPAFQGREWQLEWRSPAAGSGDVFFFYALNAANGSGNNQSDAIHFGNFRWPEDTGMVGCDLVTAEAADLASVDKLALFSDTATCAPERVPATVLVPDFTSSGSGDIDTRGEPMEPPLEVYEVLCPCPGTLRLTKSMVGMAVHADWP